jgi:hypothetical protein
VGKNRVSYDSLKLAVLAVSVVLSHSAPTRLSRFLKTVSPVTLQCYFIERRHTDLFEKEVIMPSNEEPDHVEKLIPCDVCCQNCDVKCPTTPF